MWEIFTREKPWNFVTHPWQISEKVEKGERLPLPQDCPLNSFIEECWSPDPNKRPDFSTTYEKIEMVKPNYPHQPYRNSGSSSIFFNRPNEFLSDSNRLSLAKPLEIKDSPEKMICDAFGIKNQLTWTDFSRAIVTILNATEGSMEKLKYILAPESLVYKMAWENFLKWFTPLGTSGNLYFTSKLNFVVQGWTIDEIVDIVGQRFFFGFLDASSAKAILLCLPKGSFLFRFSTTEGYYTLSLNYGGQVGHWRIHAQKAETSYPTFKIDERSYRSLQDIISTHSPGKEPLIINFESSSLHCFLEIPADRQVNRIGTNYQQL